MHQRIFRGALVAALFTSLALALLPAPALAQSWQPTIAWNTFLGGGTRPDGGAEANNDDRIEAVAYAVDGDVVVAGWTTASTFPAMPADAGLPTASSSKKDVFVARYSADGQTLRWARVFGGAEDDVAMDVAVQPSGVVFVVGRTASDSINIGPNMSASLTQYSRRGDDDGFLARLEPNGTLDYFMYLSSTLDDEARAIALGPNNLAYIVGKTGRDDGIGSRSDATPIPFPPDNALSNERLRAFEAFVSQVDVSSPGSPLIRWTRILRSAENDIAHSVAVQGDAVYVGGVVGDAYFNNDTSTSVRTPFARGANDGFVARLEGDAGISWFRHVGGSGDDDVRSVLARPEPNGGVTLVGNTDSSSSPVPGSGTDVYVLRVSANGDAFPGGGGLRLSTTGTGSERTEGRSAIDAYGNVYIGGRTLSSSGFTRNAFDTTFASGGSNLTDGFIAMVDSALQDVVMASYVGGPATEDEWVQGVAVSSGGRVAFGGHSNAANWLPVDAGVDRTSNRGTDGFLFGMLLDTTPPTAGTVTARLSADGTLTASWSGFADAETPLTYEWGIGLVARDVGTRAYEFVGANRDVTLSGFFPADEGPYYVTVRATNAAGQSVVVPSDSFRATPRPDAGMDGGTSDGGTSDGGSSDGGTSDGGTGPGDGGTGEEDGEGDRSPLGWSCASSGGSGSLALTGLLVMLALLAMRRERSGAGESVGRSRR